jgi:hypothetical protein
MTTERFQIGWYVLEKDEVFRNQFDYAAWYEDVLVKAGKYPVWARYYNFNERLRKEESHLKDFGNIFISLPGIVVGDDFSPHYGGVAIGDKSNVNTGKGSAYGWSPYAHSVAWSILEGNTRYELIEPFKAEYVHFEYDGEQKTTTKIINTEKE